LITEVPEFCGAEHILAGRAKDFETGRAVYQLVDWYKDYASKFGAVLNQNPSTGNKIGGLLNITIKSLGAMAKVAVPIVATIIGNCGAISCVPLNQLQQNNIYFLSGVVPSRGRCRSISAVGSRSSFSFS